MIAPRPSIGSCSVSHPEQIPATPTCNTGVARNRTLTTNPTNLLPPHGVYSSLDWLTATVRESGRGRFLALLEDLFGPSIPRHAVNKFYPNAIGYAEDGVAVGWNEAKPRQGIMLQIQGHWFLHHHAVQGIEYLRRVSRLAYVSSWDQDDDDGPGEPNVEQPTITRSDLAVDFVGIPLVSATLIPEATVHGHNGNYQILEAFQDHNKYTRSAADATRAGVSFGSRDSEAYVRIYDKGLEQKIAPPGVWVRNEVEFKGTKAAEVAVLVASSPNPEKTIAQIVMGTMNIPDCPVWARCRELADGAITVRPAHVQPTFERWRTGVRNSYGSALLALAEIHGADSDAQFGRFVRTLLDGVTPNPEAPVCRVVRDSLAT